MRVRTYIAESIQEALRSMRRELGEDAIILSTRTVRAAEKPDHELIEIIATAAPAHSSSPAVGEELPMASQLQQELAALRSAVHELSLQLRFGQVRSLPQWQLLWELAEREGFSEGFLLRHSAGLDPSLPLPELQQQLRHSLLQHLRYVPLPEPSHHPLRIVLTGLPGAGVTTSLLKLALFYALERSYPVQIVSAATDTLGALEQLQLFSSVTDIPVAEVHTARELQRLLGSIPPIPQVVLVELPTGNPLHGQLQQLWQSYRSAAQPDATYAVMSATESSANASAFVQAWRELGSDALVLTKLDLAVGIGAVVEVLSTAALPIVALGIGPRIPEDFAAASPGALEQFILRGQQR
jgi:flagellar biosynthesis protein FlhF